jgi:hypothetical protein
LWCHLTLPQDWQHSQALRRVTLMPNGTASSLSVWGEDERALQGLAVPHRQVMPAEQGAMPGLAGMLMLDYTQ